MPPEEKDEPILKMRHVQDGKPAPENKGGRDVGNLRAGRSHAASSKKPKPKPPKAKR